MKSIPRNKLQDKYTHECSRRTFDWLNSF